MSETVHIERDEKGPISAVELVYSPDDGGYYFGWKNFRAAPKDSRKVSADIYKSRPLALAAFRRRKIVWED